MFIKNPNHIKKNHKTNKQKTKKHPRTSLQATLKIMTKRQKT